MGCNKLSIKQPVLPDGTKTLEIRKNTNEGNALLAYIDLLATTKFYESKLEIEEKAVQIFSMMLENFRESFSEYFTAEELQNNFIVSIYADSILIYERLKTDDVVNRLVCFLLTYQATLLTNAAFLSRALLLRDSFFSLKVVDAHQSNILGSPYTSISLCGGKGIVSADNSLKGLPLGVYVSSTLINELSAELKSRRVTVSGGDLFFIKQVNDSFVSALPSEVIDVLYRSEMSCAPEDIISAMKNSSHEEEEIKKWLPWVLVHLGKQKVICKWASLSPLNLPGGSRKMKGGGLL